MRAAYYKKADSAMVQALFVGLFPPRPGFNPRPVRVGFVVDI